MNRQQAAFIIIINAIVSALISGVIVLLAFALYAPAVSERAVADATRAPAQPSATRRTTALTYVVKPGDTLSTIAANFNISTAALMQANGITNPNVLAVGQSIIVPPTDLTQLPLFATPGTVVASPAPILRITAILRPGAPQSAVGEMVIIQNVGPRVNLKGWTLADLHSNLYAFPDVVLEPNAGLRVHSEAGLDTATDLYWGRTASVWDANDTATLKDRSGVVIDSYTLRK